MASYQLPVFLPGIAILFQPFHAIDNVDAGFFKFLGKFRGKFQNSALGEALIFLLQFIFFFFQIPAQTFNLQ